jgi:hypothetical protein
MDNHGQKGDEASYINISRKNQQSDIYSLGNVIWQQPKSVLNKRQRRGSNPCLLLEVSVQGVVGGGRSEISPAAAICSACWSERRRLSSPVRFATARRATSTSTSRPPPAVTSLPPFPLSLQAAAVRGRAAAAWFHRVTKTGFHRLDHSRWMEGDELDIPIQQNYVSGDAQTSSNYKR